MNELQRQAYLSALGIENYMPSWQLPFSPAAYQCDVSLFVADYEYKKTEVEKIDNSSANASITSVLNTEIATPNILRADLITPTSKPHKVSAASILQQLEQKNAVVEIQSFALSIWRPHPGFLIIDSRQTSLALPTELFLNNVLRALLRRSIGSLMEEVLRWPMIENRFLPRTIDHARTELQTWLTAEHELRPINQLWLMGNNAAGYLLPADVKPDNCLWQRQHLTESGIIGLVLPSLNEFLQQPQLKARLWAAIQ